MKPRDSLLFFAAALVFVAVLSSCRTKTAPPNVVLINVDDLGWTDAACFGSEWYETPNIDRLASQGVRFTQAYAACAVCSPSRAAIMTGRYPARIGITDWIRAGFQLHEVGMTFPANRQNPSGYEGRPDRRMLTPRNPLWMDLEEVTIAEALNKAGYVSAHIGKWHLGYDGWYPEHQGFDVNIGGCDKGQPPTYFDPYHSERYGAGDIPTLEPRREGEYLTDREAAEACRFIREHREQPFFLHMAHYAVHTPLEAPPELVAKYESKPSPAGQNHPVYAAMVERVDRATGRILDTLEELDLSDKTLVIFTSDNGGLAPYATDNAPLRSGKGYPYEGGIRVPQIVAWPEKITSGSENDTPVSGIDIFPTICSAAGVALPADRAVDGQSLMPLLTGEGIVQRDALFWHFPHYRGEDVVPYSIVRSGSWKLIKRYDDSSFELFNLEDDLGETNDLSAEMPEKVEELDAALQSWLEAVGAKLPRPNPDYRVE